MELYKNNYYTKLLTLALLVSIMGACNPGIDPITAVDPGSDTENPEIMLTFPPNDGLIKTKDDTIDSFVQFAANDDIELAEIKIFLNDDLIEDMTSFVDYRVVNSTFPLKDLKRSQTYTVKIEVKDLSGKPATATSTFSVGLDPSEIIYLPFESNLNDLVSGHTGTLVGTASSFPKGKVGDAFSAGTDSYGTFPATEIVKYKNLTFTFLYKLNAEPDRAGILTLAPPDPDGDATADNDRTKGFRMIREGSPTSQKIKVNIGIGTKDNWLENATENNLKNSGDWIHVAFVLITSDATKSTPATAKLFFDGDLVGETELEGDIDWTDCTSLSIGSGAPNFIQWNHKSDNSVIDELNIYNKAFSDAEIKTLSQE